jgi:hypothetical protein
LSTNKFFKFFSLPQNKQKKTKRRKEMDEVEKLVGKEIETVSLNKDREQFLRRRIQSLEIESKWIKIWDENGCFNQVM